jgi:hypothetical protein
MVSFCDIPLSQTKTHIEHYGYYGIGLSKSWGQEKGINHVLYTYQASPLALSLSQSLVWIYTKYPNIRKIDPRIPHEVLAKIASIFRAEKKGPRQGKQYQQIWDKLLRIQCFIKPYEGLLRRGDKLVENVRFYDEREWRFVPDLTGDLNKYLLYEEDYNNKTARDKANNEIQERSRISFEFTDVKYIIVHHNEEIPSMIKKIEELKGDRYSPDAIKVLNSKIITADQILTDF